MKKLSSTAFVLASMLLLTACHSDKHEKKQPDIETVLVYIAGDNNLTSFIRSDISQMMAGSQELSKGNNLILFVDRLDATPYFLKVENGDTIRLKTCEQELRSSDAATLKMALSWTMENYEAQSYGLVLWGHADGWTIWQETAASRSPRRAYGMDDNGIRQWMNIPDMAQALSALPHLRFIFADCCCFQSVESAYELRQVTDYIIASPAEIPGEGAPYQTVIPALFSQRDDFYEIAAKAYCQQESMGYLEPMSVVKTSEMENLAQATRTVLAQSLQPIGSDGSGYPDVSELIYYFDQTLFDMNDFILRIADANDYATWKRTFDAAVPFKQMTTVWMANHVAYLDSWTKTSFRDFEVTEERYGGVNMFVPQNSQEDKKKHQNERISRMQWYSAAGLKDLGW